MGILYSIMWILGWFTVSFYCEAKVAWIAKERGGWKFAKQMVLCAAYNVVVILVAAACVGLWGSTGSGAI